MSARSGPLRRAIDGRSAIRRVIPAAAPPEPLDGDALRDLVDDVLAPALRERRPVTLVIVDVDGAERDRAAGRIRAVLGEPPPPMGRATAAPGIDAAALIGLARPATGGWA